MILEDVQDFNCLGNGRITKPTNSFIPITFYLIINTCFIIFKLRFRSIIFTFPTAEYAFKSRHANSIVNLSSIEYRSHISAHSVADEAVTVTMYSYHAHTHANFYIKTYKAHMQSYKIYTYITVYKKYIPKFALVLSFSRLKQLK
jgi:hypothetical protein